MRGFRGLLVAALLAAGAPADAASMQSVKVVESAKLPIVRPDFPIPAEPNQLFYLQRSTNSNTVIYAARFDANGNLDARNPVAVYWRRYNTTGERKPLKRIERLFAYGVNVTPRETEGEFTVTLKPAGNLPLLLRQTGPGKAEALAKVGDRTVRLAYIFLTVDESGLVPSVTGLSGYGIDIRTGRAIAETFAVSGGTIRP
jgi:hypothetical protein